MITRVLGAHGPEVSAIGLGCSAMSDADGPAREAESIATIHAALDNGITLIDTADFYGMGHNEMLLRNTLRGRARERVIISDKFGGLRTPMAALSAPMVVLPLLRTFLPTACADLVLITLTSIVSHVLIRMSPSKILLVQSRTW